MFKRKKIIIPIILSTVAVLLSSCGVKVREDLKEFTKDFSLNTCMEKYKEANFVYYSYLRDKGQLSATREVRYTFNMKEENNYTCTLEMWNTGLYVTSYYSEYKYLRYEKSLDNNYDYQEVSKDHNEGEERISSHIDKESMLTKLKSFFRRATAEEGGNTAGMYYGDDIKQRFAYQDYMRIDKEKNILIYEINNVVDNDENVTSLYYEVNSDGMLLNWKQTGFTTPYDNPDRQYYATMQVEYKI